MKLSQHTDWVSQLLGRIGAATRTSLLSKDERAKLCSAIRVVSAHKAWAYGHAVCGALPAGGPTTRMPRLEEALALLHSHLLDVHGVPMVEDPIMLDASVQPSDLAALDGGPAARPGASMGNHQDALGQQELF